MSAADFPAQTQHDLPARRTERNLPLFLVFVAVIAQLVALNGIERLDPLEYGYIRYLSIVPVVSVAYFYGVTYGLYAATFFGLIFLIETFWIIARVGYSASTFELVALILVLEILALVVGDLTNSLRQRTSLRKAVQARENLMSRTSNLVDLARYMIEQARVMIGAERATLIVRSPISDEWQVITADEMLSLRPDPARGEPILVEWLLAQSGAVLLNNLDRPNSPFIMETNQPFPLHSLLSRALYQSDGKELGRLILVNKADGYFQPEDLEALGDLIAVGEVAIEQARQYARTGYDLERRVNQLATIQRTSQELNATLDSEKVVDLTLEVALELTQADTGVILLNFKDLIRMLRARGADDRSLNAVQVLEKSLEESTIHSLQPEDLPLPMLFPNSQSQMLSFIRHGEDTLGLVVVESQRNEAFDQTTQWVLNLLLDYAAISLANARLFQEIQKEKQHAAMVIESVTNGLLTTDRDGRIVSANPAAEEQTGWKAAEMLGMHICKIFGLEADNEKKIRQAITEGLEYQRPFNLEPLEITTRKGGRRVISLTGSPVYEAAPEPSGMVILVRDLTEREEFNRLQEELISSISHEMRTPLAKISSISEMISSELGQDKARNYARYLDVLITESQRLAGFLDRILDVHKLETHQFDIQLRPLPVNFMVQSLVEEWRIIAPGRQIELEKPEQETWVIADENALHSVLSNLIENAVKYSGPESPIKVCIGVADDHQAEISVSDRGPGIPAEYHQRLFERFFRVNGADAQVVYGHGIGLYVAKMLVNAMGGRIWVESAPGQGSRFIFTIPVQEGLTHGS